MASMNDDSEAWAALARLLLKLHIIDDETFNQSFSSPQANPVGPISHGAFLNLFDETDVVHLVGEKLGIQVITVTKQNALTLARAIDESLLKQISLEQWREMRAAPIGRERGSLIIATANPLARHIKQSIDFTLGETTQLAIAPEAQILDLLRRRLTVTADEKFDLEPAQATSSKPLVSAAGATESNIAMSDPEAPPVVRLVNKILLDALEQEASDLHVSPESDHLDVRVRRNGVMSLLLTVPGHLSAGVISRMKLLAGMDISEKRRPQDGRLRIKVGSTHRDLRVSTVPTLHGENLVARVLNSDPTHLTFEALGMPDAILSKIVKDLSGTAQALLVTGPTGSGKTSTLYAALMHLRNGENNIITIEDPIEYRLEGVTQIQINKKIGMTFGDALRSVLRQDPDVIVVGEVRDTDTATIAMQTAQTGHVVLATLHTNSAAAAITRLKDLAIPPYLIASSVRGVLAQRLVRTLCGQCAVPDESPEAHSLAQLAAIRYCPLKAVGCAECDGTGYAGRVGVYSYLRFSNEVRDGVRDSVGEERLEQIARVGDGFTTLAQAAFRLIAEGLTSIDEATRAVGDLIPASLATIRSQQACLADPAEQYPVPLSAFSGRILTHVHDTSNGQYHASNSSSHASGNSSPHASGKKRILLVEDDPQIRMLITKFLEKALYEVIQAHDGGEAMQQVFACQPDLIVCDLHMPNVNGLQTLRLLRRDPDTVRIPVIMLTSADSYDNEVILLDGGADDFVSKFAGGRVLLSRVERLLYRSVLPR